MRETYREAIEDAKEFCEEFERYGDYHSKVNACECLERLIKLEPEPIFDDDDFFVIEYPNWEKLKKHPNFHRRLYHIFKSHINNYEHK